MIQFDHLYKCLDGNQVLNGLSGCFDTGKVSMIIGTSGTGKTVLLKCLVSLMPLDSGTVSFSGLKITTANYKEKQQIKKDMGVLFQGGALLDSMNVSENVGFPLEINSPMSLSEKQDRISYCLEKVGLSDSHKKHPNMLSGGMRKRVGLARAIITNPRYLFCDEPNSGLDPCNGQIIDELIAQLTQEYNMTTVVVTHDMNSVMAFGNKVLFLSKGLNVWEGPPSQILDAEPKDLQDFIFANKLMVLLKEKSRKGKNHVKT